MYNPTINQKKRETKTNFHQIGFKKKRGRPEEEKTSSRNRSPCVSKNATRTGIEDTTPKGQSKELVMRCTPIVMCPSLRIGEAM
jgi:hypothetical protein